MTDSLFLSLLLLALSLTVIVPTLVGLLLLIVPSVEVSITEDTETESVTYSLPLYMPSLEALQAACMLLVADWHAEVLLVVGKLRGLGQTAPTLSYRDTLKAYLIG